MAIEITKTIYFEKEFIEKLHEYTTKKDIKNFIKTYIDWMIGNNLPVKEFWLHEPYYYSSDGTCESISFNNDLPFYCWADKCFSLTGLDEEDFANMLRNLQIDGLYKYKNYLIKPAYETVWTNDAGGYYFYYRPQFLIYDIKDEIEIV